MPQRARRPGRKRDAGAKRRATTREGQGRGADLGTPEAVLRRAAVCGDASVGHVFPLDVMLARNIISEAERDEGMRYFALASWLYGTAAASCEALYERVIASGLMGEDFALTRRHEGDVPDPQEGERIGRAKARFERMVNALSSSQRFRGYMPIRGTVLEAVRNCAQFLQMPRSVEKIATGRRLLAADYIELARLQHGLARLVRLREEEEQAWRQRRGWDAAAEAA